MSETNEKAKSNVLKIGVCTLSELEEKVKAFRTINLNVKKKRFIISREDVLGPNGDIVLKKGEEFDFSKVMLLRRSVKPEQILKTFQPDEGIVIISDMASPQGIQLSMDLVTQVMNIGGGAYEAFIDRIDSFKEVSGLLNKALFPKMIIIGYISEEKKQEETAFYHLIKRADPYFRMIEVVHSAIKPTAMFPKLHSIAISNEDRDSWRRFILEVIKEYTKSYSLEEK